MCNFGTRPTFREDDLVLEVHLFDDYSEDLYDRSIWIEFLERIRSEKKFETFDLLVEQIPHRRKQGTRDRPQKTKC